MFRCTKCARPVPPRRRTCLYCGGAPKIDAAELKRAAEAGDEGAIMTLAINPSLWPGIINVDEVRALLRRAAEGGSAAAAEFLAAFT